LLLNQAVSVHIHHTVFIIMQHLGCTCQQGGVGPAGPVGAGKH
jgi:hypothetical protein